MQKNPMKTLPVTVFLFCYTAGNKLILPYSKIMLLKSALDCSIFIRSVFSEKECCISVRSFSPPPARNLISTCLVKRSALKIEDIRTNRILPYQHLLLHFMIPVESVRFLRTFCFCAMN